MKSLAKCTPREFLKQTNKIRKSVEKWLTATDIMNIRKTLPELEKIDDDADEETTRKIARRNAAKRREQSRKNLSRILDAIMDEHPDETLDLLAMVCFVEPEDVDNHPVDEYLAAISEMLDNEAVMSFFTSLAKWGQMNILK